MRRYNENELAGKNGAVDTAYEKAVALREKRVWSQSETTEVERELYTAMEKAKMLGKNDDSSFVKYTLLPFLLKVTKFISDVFEKIFGGNDYWLFFIPLI